MSQVQELGQKLFTLLLQPVAEKLLSGQVIAVELDRPLSGLAMEALHSPNGWYFGEKYPVVYSAGIVYEQSWRRQSTLSPQLPILLVDAAANGYYPGHEKEVAAIQQAFPHNFPTPASDSAVGILERLSQSAVLSFMGHGEPHETGTGLRVGPKLLLTAKDFAPRNLRHLRLAVLAACSTGSSGSDGLLDNRNLVHAFLSGGVPSVVASRWNVDSESTAVLMSDFYHGVPKEAPAQALFSARNQLLKMIDSLTGDISLQASPNPGARRITLQVGIFVVAGRVTDPNGVHAKNFHNNDLLTRFQKIKDDKDKRLDTVGDLLALKFYTTTVECKSGGFMVTVP